MWWMHVQAFLIQHEANAVEFMGNRTECALLMLLRAWGLAYEDIRSAHKAHVFQVYNFSSERKMASVLLRHGHGLRLYNKVCLVFHPQAAFSLLMWPVTRLMALVGLSCSGRVGAGRVRGDVKWQCMTCYCAPQCFIDRSKGGLECT